MEHFNTEGVVEVGEVETRLMREARVEEDYRNARAGAAVAVLTEAQMWVNQRIADAGPYDDTRPFWDLTTWLADKIREVQMLPHMEDSSATRSP